MYSTTTVGNLARMAISRAKTEIERSIRVDDIKRSSIDPMEVEHLATNYLADAIKDVQRRRPRL